MHEKYMNVKKITIPTITMAIIASQLLGCAAVSQSELLKMIQKGDMIEIEIAVPKGTNLSDEETLAWIILASLTSTPELRASWEDILKITVSGDIKNGCLYVDTEGNQENNNTLRVALHNRAFLSILEDEKTVQSLAEAAQLTYVDIDDTSDKAFYAALNAYFNLLEDQTNGEAGMDALLTRAQFMSMVMRAETPVNPDLKASDDFITAVGQSEYNIFASQVNDDCYLSTDHKNLNNKTYNSTMTRAEAIYLIVNHYFKDDLAKVGGMSAVFTDCKDGGNIAEKQKFIEKDTIRDYYRDYEMVYATQNPDDGVPSLLYNAMVIAYNKGLITSDTRWDEGITKSEAIDLLFNALKLETGIEIFNHAAGISGEHLILETEPQEPTEEQPPEETGVQGNGTSEDTPIEDEYDQAYQDQLDAEAAEEEAQAKEEEAAKAKEEEAQAKEEAAAKAKKQPTESKPKEQQPAEQKPTPPPASEDAIDKDLLDQILSIPGVGGPGTIESSESGIGLTEGGSGNFAGVTVY